MKFCLFCSSNLLLTNDPIHYPYCPNCQPTPHFVDSNGTQYIHIKMQYGGDRYLMSQEFNINIIKIHELFNIIIDYGDVDLGEEVKEYYNPQHFIEISENLTPQNAQSILDRVMNLKAFI